MGRYSGVILDRDDDRGATLKTKFPTIESLPDLVKRASLDPLPDLPDQAFALVAVDGGEVLRKYACHDQGNTAVSVLYFMEHGKNKLPPEAVKTAAQNLRYACLEHKLVPPSSLTKLAGWKERSNLADITGESVEPKVKVASADKDSDYMFVDERTREKKFPINTWDLIKKAETFMLDEGPRIKPDVRRHCCVKLAAKAEQVGYPISEKIKMAGATSFADAGHLQMHLAARKSVVDESGAKVLDELFVKHAHLGPDVYSEVLRKFDIREGVDRLWGRDIPDPWESTYGIQKTAGFSWSDGADSVTEEQLQNLAQNGSNGLESVFSRDLQNGFIMDPVGVFQSLPLPEKRVMARLAFDLANQGRAGAEVKTAALNVSDVEDSLGVYLPDKLEDIARKKIEDRTQQSFALRHPWLTGIPTLGIAPAVAKSRAVDDISRSMIRSNPNLAESVKKERLEQRQQKLEDRRLMIEQARAEQAERVADSLGRTLIGAMREKNMGDQYNNYWGYTHRGSK